MKNKNKTIGSGVDFAERLTKNPIKANWSEMLAFLKRKRAKYYEVRYSKGGIKDSDDLAKSSVRVWDTASRLIGEFPLFIKEKGNFEGSLYFFKELVQKPRK